MGSIGDGDDRRISVKLYANVPFYGRVTLASFTGALRIEGKDVSISVKIDVKVAKGVISVILEDKDLYLGLQLDILFAGHVATTFKLLTLPYAMYFLGTGLLYLFILSQIVSKISFSFSQSTY